MSDEKKHWIEHQSDGWLGVNKPRLEDGYVANQAWNAGRAENAKFWSNWSASSGSQSGKGGCSLVVLEAFAAAIWTGVMLFPYVNSLIGILACVAVVVAYLMITRVLVRGKLFYISTPIYMAAWGYLGYQWGGYFLAGLFALFCGAERLWWRSL